MRQFALIAARSAYLAAFLFAAGAAAAAETVGDLYQARVHVTGEEEPNRNRGFAAGLRDVLVKLTGDPTLIGDPAVAALGANAGNLVGAFRYRDLMAGLPIHDEQGTRQRPFILTIDFDPPKIDAALKPLGRSVWTAERPRLIVFLAVDNGTASYLLTSDGPRGRDQSEALADSAWLYGVPIGLPKQTSLNELGLFVQTVPTASLARLQAVAQNFGGDLALAGTLTWAPKALGWTANWRFAAAGKTYKWSVNGVNFDDAFRNAMLGTAQILSGHGAP
jgi:uncharacterized protein